MFYISNRQKIEVIESNQTLAEFLKSNPANIYLFKINNRNTRKRCEIRSRLTNI